MKCLQSRYILIGGAVEAVATASLPIESLGSTWLNVIHLQCLMQSHGVCFPAAAAAAVVSAARRHLQAAG